MVLRKHVVFLTTQEMSDGTAHLLHTPFLTAFNGGANAICNLDLCSRVESLNIRALRALNPLLPTSLARKERWQTLCGAAADWSRHWGDTLRGILSAPRVSWKSHDDIYRANILGIVLRLYFAKEQWLRRDYARMCRQFQVESAIELANKLIPVFE